MIVPTLVRATFVCLFQTSMYSRGQINCVISWKRLVLKFWKKIPQLVDFLLLVILLSTKLNNKWNKLTNSKLYWKNMNSRDDTVLACSFDISSNFLGKIGVQQCMLVIDTISVIKAYGLYKPSHLLIGHYILNLARHLANWDLNYVFPISAMLICAHLTRHIMSWKLQPVCFFRMTVFKCAQINMAEIGET